MFIITINDIIGLSLMVALFLFMLIYGLTIYIQQARCRHGKGYNETRSCDAICRKCGKNLGFIGALREKAGKEGK